MSGFTDTLRAIAPTVASVLGGPFAGMAVSAIGDILGVSQPTQDKISKMFTDGQLTPEQLTQIKQLELQYQNDEKERDFKYEELTFKDRDSARQMTSATHALTPAILTWIVVAITLIGEGVLMFMPRPPGVDPVVLGRILGTMDSALILVLSFWFGGTPQRPADVTNAASKK